VSKREIRAKRLVAAVLLAISVQMWSAPPLWAAEASVQTETSAAGEAKETKDAKDAKAADSETGGEADAGEEETVVVPVIGYSTRSAAGSDYGVMPLAEAADPNPNFGGMWTKNDSGIYESNGKGELTGITKINGIDFQYIEDSPSLAIGTYLSGDYSYSLAIGGGADAAANNATAVGFSTSAYGENSTAIGNSSTVYEKSGTAIGASAYVQNGHTGSVAIGYDSATTAANQVAFGTGTVTTDDGPEVVTWTNRRSLAGISDIDMEGTINLGGTWTRNAISDAYESNGKGKLTGLTSINDTEVFIGSDGDALVVNIGAYLGPGAMGTISLGEGNYVDGSYAISLGYNVTTKGSYSISIGAASQATKDYSTALGGDAYADGVDSTAIGHMSRIEGKNSTALGANSTVAAEHTNSVAIGSESATSAADQVSFGHKAGDKQTTSGSATYDTDLFRSLINVADIDMHGNISLGGELDWYDDENGKTQWRTNGKGELTGVTSINGAVLQMDVNDDEFMTSIGVKSYANSYGSAFGWYARADGQYSVAVGYAAETDRAGVALGYNAKAKADGGTSLGMAAEVGEEHTNSVAIGSYSVTNAANQVSFGHKTGDNDVESGLTYKTDLFRSLVNVADIDMHGNISLGGEWNDNKTSGLYESNGKGELNGVTSINGVIFAKDSMNNQEGLLIGTLAPDTYYSGSWSVMIGTNIDNQAIEAVGIGNDIKLTGDGSVAIGNSAEALSSGGGYPMAIGFSARAIGDDVVAIGAKSYAEHEYSVALGDDSSTSAENQVSFGHKAGDKYGDGVRDTYGRDLFRSLVNVADIEMHGNISLGGEWSWNDAGTSYKSNGLGNLTGVIGINGIEFLNYDCGDGPVLAIGSTIGNDSTANSVGLGINNTIEGYGSVSIGVGTNVRGNDATGVGSGVSADGENSVAVGSNAFATADGATAVGSASRVYAEGGSALGYGTSVAAAHTNSVAIGAKSATGAANQVSFGHKVGDRNEYGGSNFTDDLFRSLVNVADIEMHGALTGVTGIDGVTVSGTDASTGLTVGGNAVIGKTDTPFSSTGFAVAKDGAVTAKTVNGATITGTGFNGVTLSTDGKVNGAVITSNSFNGVTLEKGADSHYKVGGVDVTKMQTDVAGKADAATTLTGYGITDAYTKTETDTAVGKKADKATTLTGYGIADAYTKTETDTAIGKKADKATTLTGYGIADAYTKTETDTAIGKKADKATTLTGYGITDAYTKTAADEKITAATADMATKTQVTADIGTAKTALESAYQAADTALSDRAAALETAATGMSYDAGKNTTTFTGGVTATVLTAGEFKVGATGFGFGNDGALTAKTVNGIEIKKDESKVMVGGIDLTALSNGDVVTDNTKGIGRNQDTATTTIETNTAISSSGITTNAVTASGTVKAGEFVEGSQKLSDKYAAKTALADYTTTTDMNTKFADYATTTAVDTKLADYAKSDSVYSKAAADTAFAKAGDVDTLKTTVGDADGGLVKDVTELQSGKADKATTLAGYGIADAYTQTEINEKIVEATKDLATSATVTDIQSGLDEVTGKTAGLSYDTASGSSKFSGSVVIGNEGAKTHTQITDDAIIFGEGTDKQVTVDASGIHVGKKAAGGIALYADADGTHIDHTSLVTGSVTADNLNGVAISGNATDGLSVGGVSIKALSERLDSLEQDGVATADMGGIKRTDVVENSGKTIIEDTTSFTKDGLKTANLEAATAALGGVNFAAGAVTGVSSINGVVFGSDGKIGGVSLSGGKVDGVDVGWLDQRVKSLEDNGTGGGGTGGGGSSANTSGIHKPDRDTTNIEGNTSITTDGIDTNKVNASDAIVVADGEKNKTVISKDGILVAEGEKNQVKINEDGIHVGKNSSVVNDTDGFITDKGLYIGVSSSSDTSTAKFSVAPNGNLSSKAGDYGFSNTSADGAKFTHSGDTAYGTGSQLDTTIQGNKVTTGRIDTDELYVDGNKVTVAGGTIDKTDAVNNHLSGADADGNTVTNDFKTSAVNGTTQAAEKTSADGKESTKTVNNTSAGGTGVTTSKTTTDSKDNVTVKESSFGTNEKGMTLSTSNKVTDKDGKVTKDTSGTTTMTGDSISVSKTTTTTEKDADGNEKEVTKTSGTTIGSGEVTLKREDGSTIEVGSAIEGMQSDMRELDGRVSRMGVEIKEVGALSAALAGLHPQPENANSRADFAMAMGSYEGKQALAVGGFYRPDKRTMLSIGASTTSSKHMMNMGISIALDRLPEAERRAKEAAKAAGVEQETLNRVLERLAALEQDNRRLQADNEKRDVAYEKLAADYTQLKEKYIEETADRQQPEQAEAEE